jgi:peptidoglycan/xylan/chitin deacetylase (PgdA/CDA1 family)
MWPDGARCAASFTFDFDAEEVWIGSDPGNAHRPGVLSQGTYGAKVAVPHLLALLQRHRVRATFFVPGRVGERHPERVAAIVAAGHELAHHGYTHTAPSRLSRDEEEAELARGLEVLRSFGTEITGYRSPSWDFSPDTLGLLAGHGFAYSSNMMDDV